MPCAQAAALKACEAQEKLEGTNSGVKAKPKTKQSKACYDAECILAETEDKYKVNKISQSKNTIIAAVKCEMM